MLVLWSLPQYLGPPLSNLREERQGNARGRNASVRPPVTSCQHTCPVVAPVYPAPEGPGTAALALGECGHAPHTLVRTDQRARGP